MQPPRTAVEIYEISRNSLYTSMVSEFRFSEMPRVMTGRRIVIKDDITISIGRAFEELV